MSGITSFPTALDDDSSLLDVTDASSQVLASHHNNLKEAVKAIEKKIGIFGTGAPTSLDFRLSDPTLGHRHDGASGAGGILQPSAIPAPSGAAGGATSLFGHLMDQTLHSASAVRRHVVPWDYQGSLASGPSIGAPFSFGLTAQIESVQGQMRRSPSGATTALTVRFGATALWGASVGLRPIFAPGTNGYAGASPNLGTYPSGARIQVDVDTVGSNDPGQDLRLTFVFKE
jgi:hypothetical protein